MSATEIIQYDSRVYGVLLQEQLRNQFAKTVKHATPDELFRAVAGVLRPQIVNSLIRTAARFQAAEVKSLYYLSMEFLLGRSLSNNLHNLGLYATLEDAFSELGLRLTDIVEVEPDAALGNGGLGRLAACFLDSLASLHMPGYGYGIHYEYGLFRQELEDGHQKERPDFWASHNSPWLIEHLDQAIVIPLYGRVEHGTDRKGRYNPMWLDWKVLVGVPHDLPIVGGDGETVNTLRLFSARASDEFDISIFNEGDYLRAVEQKMKSETVSKLLYPPDSFAAGRELRFIQEYFLVACSIRDIFRKYLSRHSDPRLLASKAAIQLNDTHPALTVAELMRLLVDEHDLPWEEAWQITQDTCGYTNHTLMPEALEKWPVDLFERVLPRHYQIVLEINRRLLSEVAERWPGDAGRQARMSLIEEAPQPMIRMANLAIVGSHAVNGVAAMHSDLVKTDLVPDFHQFFPGRFGNKTNGVSPRRWLAHVNPALASWITARIGESWRRDLGRLRDLEPFAWDAPSQRAFLSVKRENKRRLSRTILEATGVNTDCDALFDVQVKRIHEYKRQLLHALGTIDQYLRIVEDGREDVKRVHVFAGKAAPGYFMAKLIIKLINNLAELVGRDPRTRDCLKVVFLPDYKVSSAEVIVPAADLSEQISTAGMEASGTSNMKFAMNGALTIGTMDGANVEMVAEIGRDNMLIFGHSVEEVRELRCNGYQPRLPYEADPRVRRAVEMLRSERLSPGEPGIFEPIYNALVRDDYFLNIADLGSYLAAQQQASDWYREQALWSCKAILNVARSGFFSSDRTIAEYARDIWKIRRVVPEVL